MGSYGSYGCNLLFYLKTGLASHLITPMYLLSPYIAPVDAVFPPKSAIMDLCFGSM